MTKQILLINGPNLNLLGTRQPELYGSSTLTSISSTCKSHAQSLGVLLSTFQSNHEGAIVDKIHAARNEVDVIVINPAAFTHTSVAIRDALLGVDIPFIEIHVTNMHARKEFTQRSYLSDKAEAVVMGMGAFGYVAAVEHAVRMGWMEQVKTGAVSVCSAWAELAIRIRLDLQFLTTTLNTSLCCQVLLCDNM